MIGLFPDDLTMRTTTQPYLIVLFILISTTAAINTNNHILPRTNQDESNNLPVPFDTSLDADNFTKTACPHFLTTNFASSSSPFASCRPLSLLLHDSTEFFTKTLRSENATASFLDSACAVDAASCSDQLQSLANDLLQNANCGADYQLRNPLVVDAYQGLVAYEAVYRASCLKSSNTGRYCFVDALFSSSSSKNSSSSSNSSSNSNSTKRSSTKTTPPPPGDYDLFSVPLGSELTQDPARYGDSAGEQDSFLSCSDCVRREMQVYAEFARRNGQPVAGSYLPSAQVVNQWCGDGFVDLNITVGSKASAVSVSGVFGVVKPSLGLGGVLLMVGLVVAGQGYGS